MKIRIRWFSWVFIGIVVLWVLSGLAMPWDQGYVAMSDKGTQGEVSVSDFLTPYTLSKNPEILRMVK